MAGIRVVLAHMPPMLQGIISDAAIREPDVEIVCVVELGEPILPVVEAVRPDALILGASPVDERALAGDVWRMCPRTRVLTIADGGRRAVLRVLHPRQTVIEDVSVPDLIAAIRAVPEW